MVLSKFVAVYSGASRETLPGAAAARLGAASGLIAFLGMYGAAIEIGCRRTLRKPCRIHCPALLQMGAKARAHLKAQDVEPRLRHRGRDGTGELAAATALCGRLTPTGLLDCHDRRRPHLLFFVTSRRLPFATGAIAAHCAGSDKFTTLAVNRLAF